MYEKQLNEKQFLNVKELELVTFVVIHNDNNLSELHWTDWQPQKSSVDNGWMDYTIQNFFN